MLPGAPGRARALARGLTSPISSVRPTVPGRCSLRGGAACRHDRIDVGDGRRRYEGRRDGGDGRAHATHLVAALTIETMSGENEIHRHSQSFIDVDRGQNRPPLVEDQAPARRRARPLQPLERRSWDPRFCVAPPQREFRLRLASSSKPASTPAAGRIVVTSTSRSPGELRSDPPPAIDHAWPQHAATCFPTAARTLTSVVKLHPIKSPKGTPKGRLPLL